MVRAPACAPQFWTTAQRATRGQAERRLLLAVLQDALLTLAVHARRGTRKSNRLAEEVRRWVASDSRSHPFTFGAICDILGLDPSYIRCSLRRLHHADMPLPYRRDYAGRGRHVVERSRTGT